MNFKKLNLTVLLSVVLFSCSNDETIENQTEDAITNESRAPQPKVDIVHNGNHISVNENAVMAHLSHGDILGTVEDNVILQGVLTDLQPLDFNDPLYVAFRNSEEFSLYNESIFRGTLELDQAYLISTPITDLIGIPVTPFPKTVIPTTIFVGFVDSNQNEETSFSSLVISSDLQSVGDGEIIAGLNLGIVSGAIKYSFPEGDPLVDIEIENNIITDFDLTRLDNPRPKRTNIEECSRVLQIACVADPGCALSCAVNDFITNNSDSIDDITFWSATTALFCEFVLGFEK